MIARGIRLDRRERAHAARALGWLIAATIAVRVFPYATLTRLIDRIPSRRSARYAIGPAECAIAIRRAVRVWPAHCLPQAIAGYCMLRRAGLSPTFTVGVAREGHRFDAHAWLECEGVSVTGGEVDRRYAPIAAAGRQP